MTVLVVINQSIRTYLNPNPKPKSVYSAKQILGSQWLIFLLYMIYYTRISWFNQELHDMQYLAKLHPYYATLQSE